MDVPPQEVKVLSLHMIFTHANAAVALPLLHVFVHFVYSFSSDWLERKLWDLGRKKSVA